MIRTEIFMEGVQLDISADISALFTYAIDDVRDFGSKNTNYSKTISLPGSGRNNAIFGHVFEFTGYNPYDPAGANIGLNFNAAKAAQCVVLVDGVQVFKGVLRLMEAVQVGEFRQFECAVFGELGGLMSAIGARLLTGNISPDDDLDFSGYNAAWTTGNMTISWQNQLIFGGGSGVYWPLINYGNVTANQVDYQYKALRPALYLAEYLDKIITKAGYTYDCAFFATAFFKRCIIPHNEDQVYKLVNTLVNYQNAAGQASFLHSIFSGGGAVLGPVKFKFPTAATGPYNFTVSGTGNTDYTYTAANSILAKVTIQLYLEWGGGENRVDYSTEIKVNGTLIQTASFTLNGDNTYLVGSVTAQHAGAQTIVVQNLVLNQNDVITIDGKATVTGTLTGQWELRVKAGPVSYIQVDAYHVQTVPASYGDVIPINNCIPKGVQQSDIVLAVAKMFNLYITEDKFRSKHLNIVPYPDFYDIGNPEDWTGKLDRSKEMRLKPMGELNARYFNFQYDKDSDAYNDAYQKKHNAGYADRTFDVGLDFVQEKKELKIVFAPSPLVGYVGKDKYVTAIYKIESGAEVATSSKIRILQAKVPTVGSWNILDGATVKTTRTDYGYAGHVDNPVNPTGADLNFGAPAEIFWTPPVAYTAPNLVNAFYSAYMAEITDKDSKLLTCFVRLSVVDIYNLDWTRPKIIDGQLWRLNKIIDYDAIEEGVTKVELLKIINLSY